jgi:hypothetical protein
LLFIAGFAWKHTRDWNVDIAVGMPISSTDKAVSWSEGSEPPARWTLTPLARAVRKIHVSGSAGIELPDDTEGIWPFALFPAGQGGAPGGGAPCGALPARCSRGVLRGKLWWQFQLVFPKYTQNRGFLS